MSFALQTKVYSVRHFTELGLLCIPSCCFADLIRPYVYNALKTLRTAHANVWNDNDVKNVHYILGKPWNDEAVGNSSEETHLWWWEIDQERTLAEAAAGLTEPDWT
jgi:hypothetical protein